MVDLHPASVSYLSSLDLFLGLLARTIVIIAHGHVRGGRYAYTRLLQCKESSSNLDPWDTYRSPVILLLLFFYFILHGERGMVYHGEYGFRTSHS